MRTLLDECVPVALKRNLVSFGRECQTVREAGFAGKKKGELLTLAERRWDVLLTTDRKIEYQQHMIGRKIGISSTCEDEPAAGSAAHFANLRASAALNPTRAGS
jgi:predicted nuclease of predicted toxin-antitoxin system